VLTKLDEVRLSTLIGIYPDGRSPSFRTNSPRSCITAGSHGVSAPVNAPARRKNEVRPLFFVSFRTPALVAPDTMVVQVQAHSSKPGEETTTKIQRDQDFRGRGHYRRHHDCSVRQYACPRRRIGGHLIGGFGGNIGHDRVLAKGWSVSTVTARVFAWVGSATPRRRRPASREDSPWPWRARISHTAASRVSHGTSSRHPRTVVLLSVVQRRR
jgi:hypothetical protein